MAAKKPQKPLARSFPSKHDPWHTLRSKPGITIKDTAVRTPKGEVK